ncbi:MAG: relaxase/mobilization nuclease domain-containing protein, partial [Synergistaceae bacterium]|nr:relaxase/mobilization nuclease domain-containing protein [Synergistaceae bacterium]
MIGKHITNPKTRSSFSALNAYITGKSKGRPQGEKIAFTGCLNLASVETATLEMESLAFLNKRCKDPVMHLLLSWKENERPSAEQAKEAVRITLDTLGLSQCQAVYSLHQNTDNMHLHICVSRIDPETHRAVTAGGGWSRRSMEKAARQVEHAQGWASAENAWSEFDENGELVRKPVDSYTAKIPQKVKDAENLTGEQSAIRKAQEALTGNINGIRDLDGLHSLMAANGMRYEKKGSGAIIHVGDIAVKASSVSRDLSLNKLEKRIGAYQPLSETERQLNSERTLSDPKPLDKSNDNADWRAYIAERKSYYSDKKQFRERLVMSQREDKSAMRDRQARERTELLAS